MHTVYPTSPSDTFVPPVTLLMILSRQFSVFRHHHVLRLESLSILLLDPLEPRINLRPTHPLRLQSNGCFQDQT